MPRCRGHRARPGFPRLPALPRLPLLLAAAAALSVSLGAAAGRGVAAPEGGTVVTLDVGGGVLRADRRWRSGGQAGLEVQYGLAEPWSLRAAAHVGWFAAEPGASARSGMGQVGGLVSLDVLQLVPFAELSLAVLSLAGDVRDPGSFAGLQLGAGASYLLDRRWAVGGLLRAQYFGLRLTGDSTGGVGPLLLGALVRLERHF